MVFEELRTLVFSFDFYVAVALALIYGKAILNTTVEKLDVVLKFVKEFVE